MLEPLNIKPEPISKNDACWFQPLFFECFNKEESWLKHLEDHKYKAFHINQQAFIFTYTVEEQTDILSIGVAENSRKQGLAMALVKWIIDGALNNQKFFLEVECGNTAAINLYKKIGFKQISIRKGYYEKGDALVMLFNK